MCEVACEQNSRGLRIVVVKIYQRVASAWENRIVKQYNEQAVIVIVVYVGNIR